MNTNPGSAPGESSTRKASQTFAHGVASGDPTTDRVVIWTRISGITDPLVAVQWIDATDVALSEVGGEGTAASSAGVDWTVHVDVPGLAAATTSYYGFVVGTERSVVGRTR